jgi:D-glycero-D-manno-heptose 1,7-bisphosphate phosphatase
LDSNVVFLDRDGVINRDSPDYIKSWSEFHFLPGSLNALARLTRHGYQLIVITNQSMINRNMVAIDTLLHMHDRMLAEIRRHGGEIKDIFFCPHTPAERCDCRKPLPGLIHRARKAHQINIEAAGMIGDSAKDIECARNAGCGYSILVQTGNGLSAGDELHQKGIRPDHTAATLLSAVDWILTQHHPNIPTS